MKLRMLAVCIVIFVFHGMPAGAAEVAISNASSECLDCHAITHPGIVKGWHNSRHSRITPGRAMAVEGLARKVSSTTVPENLQSTVVGCAECHMLRPDAHADSFEHNGYQVHVVVSPDDCKTCHSEEAGQYEKNLMSFAYNNLAGNALYQMQQRSIIGGLEKADGKLQATPANDDTRAEACYYCHGTRLKVTGTEIRDTEVAGELEFPVIEGWPNQGVGRLNLDGSRGSCSACHTRHGFDIEMARKPYTCKECHIGPDVPASKVYESSKHGNIFSALNTGWDFKRVPWTIGEDFTAPTCAVCHISLIVNADQEVVVKRTHQLNNRLPWRIFGLIYAHPHPLQPDTTIIRNKDGQPLPTDFAGGFAREFLVSDEEMDIRRRSMQAVCLNCHGTSWVRSHWRRFENTIQETNAKTLTATRIMEEAWQTGFARGLPDSPFDEAIEKRWSDTWLFYANTIRFASSMGGGGDYGVFAGGRYELAQAILELYDWPGRKAPGKPSQ